MQKLARYWGTEYDWRKVEARLNALPKFITEIDGLDIHFIHVRSKHNNALPLIVTHGWPGSIIEQMKIIDPLTDPTAHGGSAGGCLRRGDSVNARLRIFGQTDHHRLGSRPHRARLGRADEAPRIHEVRGARRRLGRDRHRRDGYTGASRTGRHPLQHARRVPPDIDKAALRALRRRPVSPPTRNSRTSSSSLICKGIGYGYQMGLRPQAHLRDRRFSRRHSRLFPRSRRAQFGNDLTRL